MNREKGGFIKIYIQPGQHPSPYDYEGWVTIDPLWVGEAFAEIDSPSKDASALTMMLCTDVEQRTQIIEKREVIAKKLSAMLTEHVMNAFEAKDKENGYNKKEWEEFRRDGE